MSNMVTAIRSALSGQGETPEAKKALAAISAARTSLMLDAPFYGALALRLTPDCNPMTAQGTCATDGRKLYFAPDFINELSHKQLVGLLAHEVMHVALEHTLRREGRNMRDWNIACDHAINNDLQDSGFALPEGGCVDRKFRGWSSEEIFPHVARPQSEQRTIGQAIAAQRMSGSGGAPQSGGKPMPQEPDGEEEESDGAGSGGPREEEEQSGGGAGEQPEPLPAGAVLDSPDPVGDAAELHVAMIEAAMCAKAAGNMPGNLQRLVNSLTHAKISFRELLAEFLERTCRDDYSFSQPNRRYLQSGVYLPSLKSEAAPEIAFFIDTSGSISEAQLAVAVNALDDCLAQVQPERVYVICCDTRVTWRHTYERGERLKVEPVGGGGTDFEPPFKALEQDGIEPVCALYFTDGYGRFPEREPPYPVLWLMTCDNTNAPWGQAIGVGEVK